MCLLDIFLYLIFRAAVVFMSSTRVAFVEEWVVRMRRRNKKRWCCKAMDSWNRIGLACAVVCLVNLEWYCVVFVRPLLSSSPRLGITTLAALPGRAGCIECVHPWGRGWREKERANGTYLPFVGATMRSYNLHRRSCAAIGTSKRRKELAIWRNLQHLNKIVTPLANTIY